MPKISDSERVKLVDKTMAQLGFRRQWPKIIPASDGDTFTDLLLYTGMDNSKELVAVHFPDRLDADHGTKLATKSVFNNRISRKWETLEEFMESAAFWIAACRKTP